MAIILLLSRALQMSTPLILGSIAEVYSEKTGVMNIAIEGVFLIGAWAGFVGAFTTENIVIGFLTALLAGMIVGLVYGFITIILKQHQIVTGVALNILLAALAVYLYRVIFGVRVTPLKIKPLSRLALPLLSDIPVVGEILFNQNVMTYIVLLFVPLAYYVLYKTRIGLIIRSTGANPEAVDAAGIKVEKVRYLTIIVSSGFAALAGSFYTLAFLGMFSQDIIGGRGWIAFAICFLGNWHPVGALLGALAFGLADGLSVFFQTASVKIIPNEFIIALPYILTIAATVARKSFSVPEYLGVPYVKEEN
ncbi:MULTISPECIES: ABC transporter permease [Halanaerobium]|jgi:simple sugar transport system permease protein|uniref:Simple sugar transport system permease protein n=1 Tax=Halanaerobium kushneri TaxID=56779 RepID=A0A1N6Z594_9FIRM|nr:MULTISPECIES: ABC transporter permease [Halanaerobium]RCW62326.1 simple sugar transport system permease protein [Halanaerobium sp. ST460_2HS_T2]SIR22022.1 simple sugar transport system permease protein [Halanaerobium kushneri]